MRRIVVIALTLAFVGILTYALSGQATQSTTEPRACATDDTGQDVQEDDPRWRWDVCGNRSR